MTWTAFVKKIGSSSTSDFLSGNFACFQSKLMTKKCHVNKKFTVAGVLIFTHPIVGAEGPSTFEGAGVLDAYIQWCGASNPKKSDYYRQKIPASFSCGKTVSEMERLLKEIRESKNSEVIASYQKSFKQTLKQMDPATDEQKKEFCELLAEGSC
jgi:hypothetical protein